jgi:hypothetical protein
MLAVSFGIFAVWSECWGCMINTRNVSLLPDRNCMVFYYPELKHSTMLCY